MENKNGKINTSSVVVRRKAEEPPNPTEVDSLQTGTKSLAGKVLDKKFKDYIPDFEDFHLQVSSLNASEMAFFNEVMDSPNILSKGDFVEREISGGRNAQPNLNDFNELTRKEGLKKLLGENIFTEEVLKSLGGKINPEKFVNDFERLIIELFEQCNSGSSDPRSVLDRLYKHKERIRKDKFNHISKELFYSIFHQTLLRLSTLFQQDQWCPEEPGAKEDNFFHGWTTIYKDLFAKYLLGKNLIEDEEDLVMFNTSGTPADYLSQTDSFFSIVSGPNEGMVFGVDYTVNPEKPKRRATGRRFFVDSEKLKSLVREAHSNIKMEGLKNILDELQSSKSNLIKFKESLLKNPRKNAGYKRLKQILTDLRKDIYVKVFKPGFDEYVEGINGELSSLKSKQKAIKSGGGKVDSRYIPDISSLNNDLEELQDRRGTKKRGSK